VCPAHQPREVAAAGREPRPRQEVLVEALRGQPPPRADEDGAGEEHPRHQARAVPGCLGGAPQRHDAEHRADAEDDRRITQAGGQEVHIDRHPRDPVARRSEGEVILGDGDERGAGRHPEQGGEHEPDETPDAGDHQLGEVLETLDLPWVELVRREAAFARGADRVRRAHERAPTTRDEVVERAAADLRLVVLKVVDVAADRRDEAVARLRHDLVHAAAALDLAVLERVVHHQRLAGEQHLGLALLGRSRSQPVPLRLVELAVDAGVDADQPYVLGVDDVVRAGLQRPFGSFAPAPLQVGAVADRRRTTPEPAHEALVERRIAVPVVAPGERLGVTEVPHEPRQPVIPIMVTGNGENRLLEVLVRDVVAVAVIVDIT
jgi:hypothetical protein